MNEEPNGWNAWSKVMAGKVDSQEKTLVTLKELYDKINETVIKILATAEHFKEDLKDAEGVCDKCIVKKIVFAVVGLMGLGVIGAVLALVIKKGTP
jgi:hypothetical protein